MDKTSLTLGWLVGRQIAGQRRAVEKQPIAYLFNGVQMPPLPEWDREMYPYAAILGDSAGNFWNYSTRLILSTVPLLYAGDNILYWSAMYGTAAGSSIAYEWSNLNDSMLITYEPGFIRAENLDETFEAGGGASARGLANNLLWANYDVYKHPSGTTLVLAASDPIPVYE